MTAKPAYHLSLDSLSNVQAQDLLSSSRKYSLTDRPTKQHSKTQGTTSTMDTQQYLKLRKEPFEQAYLFSGANLKKTCSEPAIFGTRTSNNNTSNKQVVGFSINSGHKLSHEYVPRKGYRQAQGYNKIKAQSVNISTHAPARHTIETPHSAVVSCLPHA